ncbi:complement C1q-like protein 2 [Mercenaria mercenaria]|uniref:complement C1q-like protein 2 n=1 Tax=Mercenaria mercenaria TaxID=6596 RepID=UPI00234EC3ED|nr:complement C1q-like protein 2 [Mercenaria mercenaria]
MLLYYTLSILAILLGVEVLVVMKKMEKLQAAYDTLLESSRNRNIQDCEYDGMGSRTRSCPNKAHSSDGTACDGDNTQCESFNEKRRPPIISAFSVSDPRSVSSPETEYKLQQYTTVNINEGKDFNPSAGIFTCSKPGVYYFTATLIKKRADVSVDRVDLVQCYIYKNMSPQILLYADPTDNDTDKGHAAISNSVVLRLDTDDIVYLGWCDDPNTSLEKWTSFSGFLLYPDS